MQAGFQPHLEFQDKQTKTLARAGIRFRKRGPDSVWSNNLIVRGAHTCKMGCQGTDSVHTNLSQAHSDSVVDSANVYDPRLYALDHDVQASHCDLNVVDAVLDEDGRVESVVLGGRRAASLVLAKFVRALEPPHT